MMIQSSIITIFLVSTCLQSFSMVHAFEADDAAAFTEPFNKLTSAASTQGDGLLPGGGIEGLVGGVVPDVKKLATGSLGKRGDEPTADYPQDDNIPKSYGQGVATYTPGQNGDGSALDIGQNLLAQLKKRYNEGNPQGEMNAQYSAPKAPQGKTTVSLLSLRRRNDLGLGRRNDLRGGLSGGGDNAGSGNGDTTVSLLGLRRRAIGGESGSAPGGHTDVSLLNPKELLGGGSAESTEGTGNSISLLGKRNTATDAANGVYGYPIGRRSTSVLSGTERMDRARQGVVVDTQSKAGFVDRRAVRARDHDDDQHIVDEYNKLMKERQEDYNKGQQQQEKKGSTHIALASLRRRLINDVMQGLTEKLALTGPTSQVDGGLVEDVTSTV